MRSVSCFGFALCGSHARNELTPVLKTLRKNGIDVVAIHHHMTQERPLVIFLHYSGQGPPDKLASAFKATLDQLGAGARAYATSH